MEPILKKDTLELASREEGTIWVCNGPDSQDHLPRFTSTGVFEPLKSSIDRFRSFIHRFIKPLADCTAELEVPKEGLSYRPTSTLNRPIIAAIPKDKLMAEHLIRSEHGNSECMCALGMATMVLP